MTRGYLSEYFVGVAIKRLSAVEADRTRSNQHEYNATREMLAFMGRPSTRTRLPTRFIYLDSKTDEPIIEDAFLTLYDSRENQPHRSAEYRFYFPTSQVSEKAGQGDLLLIGKKHDGNLLVVIAGSGSSAANQIKWLFGFTSDNTEIFSVRSELDDEQYRIGFAASVILESIGVEVEKREENYLDSMLSKFGGGFPKTREFSAYARETVGNIDPREDPDAAFVAWMDREDSLFRALERHLVSARLDEGFSGDTVDDFIKFSLSVHQRRKSRVGYALENHLKFIFSEIGIRYKHGAITENKTKPDFIFPGQDEYNDINFDTSKLSMLAVKSTCKDRWRQALAEADRIDEKHLLTLEAGISVNQTNEMQAKKLQLVLPRSLHSSYSPEQQAWLYDIEQFTQLVRERQSWP
ncbi:MAG: type II restriction endonuclease [Lysobacteraceae bacterium]